MLSKIGSRWNKSGFAGSLDFFSKKTGGSVLTITEGGVIAPNPSGAQDYFVDLNASSASSAVAMAAHDAGVDGKSWGTAFQLISSAIAASNTSIGLTANRWGARRNRIFVCGDGITEDLTVLPEKTDIIGVGSDLYPFPRVIGHQHIAAAKVGCRFINMGFQDTDGTTHIVIPAGCHGLQFIDCTFIPKSGGTTIGLAITDCALLKISGCRFQIGGGDWSAKYGTAISLLGTIGHESEISNNHILGGVGILTATALVAMGSIISDNYIRTTGITVNDVAQDYILVNNRLITDVSTETVASGVVSNPNIACGNILMGSGGSGSADGYPWVRIAN